MIHFTKVRNDFIESPGLTPTEKLVAIYLYGRMRRDRKPWQVDVGQICAALHLGEDAARRALKRLKAEGWLTDNAKPVRDRNGRIRRERSTVIESRRPAIIAPDGEFPKVTPKAGFPTSVNPPSNEQLSNEQPYASEPADLDGWRAESKKRKEQRERAAQGTASETHVTRTRPRLDE